MQNKKATVKNLGAFGEGIGQEAPKICPVNVQLPELGALIDRLDLLIRKEPAQPVVHVSVPPLPVQEPPVINLPEYPTPHVTIEHPAPHPVRLEMHLSRPWEMYLLLFGVYVLIFLLSWHYVPNVQ